MAAEDGRLWVPSVITSYRLTAMLRNGNWLGCWNITSRLYARRVVVRNVASTLMVIHRPTYCVLDLRYRMCLFLRIFIHLANMVDNKQ